MTVSEHNYFGYNNTTKITLLQMITLLQKVIFLEL